MENEMAQNEYEEMEQDPRRNKFTTFWLWLMIIANVLVITYTLFIYAANEFLRYELGSLIVSVGAGAILIYGVVRLLNWKKDGFKTVIGAMGLNVSWMFIHGNFEIAIIQLVGSIIGIGILWGVLQCTKDGVSCWSQLR